MSSKNLPIYIAASKISGQGSFAQRDIKVGEIINIFGSIEYSEQEIDELIEKGKLRLDDDFQIDEDRFLVGLGHDYFTNHSCDPNAGIKNVNQIVAIRNIKKDEEITFDYSTVSGPTKNQSKLSNESWFMVCNCGAKNCRGKIGFALSLPKKTIDKYLGLGIIPDFIRRN